MQRLTTKTRIAIQFGTLTLLVLSLMGLAFSGIFYLSANSRFQSDQIREAYELLNQHISYQNDRIIYLKDAQGIFIRQHILDEGSQAIIYNSKGEVIGAFGTYEQRLQDNSYQTDNAAIQKTLASNNYQFASETDNQQGTFSVLYYPILAGSKTVGVIQLTKDSSFLNQILKSNFEVLLLLLPLAAVLSAFLGYTLANGAFAPVRRLLVKMNIINSNNLTEKVVINGSPDDELNQLALTYNEMLDRLREGVEKQKEFTANVSHELRKPLTRAVSGLEVAKLQIQENQQDKAEQELDSVKLDLMQLNQTVESLLKIARMSADPFIYEEIDVKSEVDAALARLEPEIQRRAIKVEIRVPQTAHILFMRNHLQIILNNLLSNAVKYNVPRGEVQIILELSEDKKNYALLVKDTGIGISKTNQGMLFQRFFRAANLVNKVEGHGLGLTLVKTLCQMHQLDLQINSQSKLGTTVSVKFFRTV